jgi:hypothetical protein
MRPAKTNEALLKDELSELRSLNCTRRESWADHWDVERYLSQVCSKGETARDFRQGLAELDGSEAAKSRSS